VTDLFLLPPDRVVATVFHNPPPPAPAPPPGTPPDLDAIIAAYRDATSLARFCWVPFMSDPKLERRLRRVTAPTLVVAPSDDRLIPAEHARRYAARIPGAAYAEVPDCGHAMYFEKPAEFASSVSEFLSAHPLAARESGVSR
jgi:pimeloyl-ACP methyl ester carboxylesterase